MLNASTIASGVATASLLAASLALGSAANPVPANAAPAVEVTAAKPVEVRYGREEVEGVGVFFREAGDPSKPTLVLLHGFPHSSHQYRNLIRDLGDD